MRELKGEGHPVVCLEDRARALASYKGIDCVIHTDNVSRVIEKIKPDIFLKGGDYTISKFPQAEQRACAGVSEPGPCEIVLVPQDPTPIHSSDILRKVEARVRRLSPPQSDNSAVSVPDSILFYFELIKFGCMVISGICSISYMAYRATKVRRLRVVRGRMLQTKQTHR